MKKLLLVAALPLLFSACKQPEPPAAVTDPVASTEPAGQRAALPKGIALSVPYAIISDDWTDDAESRKRKTVIEFERADAASIGREITESMIKARYRLTGTSEVRGGERFNFRGDPGVRVTILVRPRGAVALQNDASTGNIEFGYSEPRQAPAAGQETN
nr:hypothetical protein [uncultured Pseudoxanthomonas sp.]